MFFPAGVTDGHDRKPVKEKHNEHERNDTEKATTSESDAPQPKAKRAAAKKATAAKKVGPAKKTATKPKADRANKKAEVIAMMKRSWAARAGRRSTSPRTLRASGAYKTGK
jgi:hypothetical protein